MRPISLSRLPPITCRSSSVKCPQFSRTCPLYCFHLPSNWSKFMVGLPLCDRMRAGTPLRGASEYRVRTSTAPSRNALASGGADSEVEPAEQHPSLRGPVAHLHARPSAVYFCRGSGG